jgi:hypothetical protein
MDIARHARRRILLRDGAIVEDTRRTLLDLPAHAEAMP